MFAKIPFLLLVIGALLAPAVSGSTSRDVALAGETLASVRIEDRFGERCFDAIDLVPCEFEHRPGNPDDPGDDVLSFETGRVRASVVVHAGGLPVLGPLVAPLLPDGAVALRFDDVSVESPLFPTYMELRERTGPWPTEPVAGARADEGGLTFHTPYASPAKPGLVYTREKTIVWSSDAQLDYRHLYFPNEMGNTSTDEALLLPTRAACGSDYRAVAAPACAAADSDSLNGTILGAVPEVRVGLDADAVHAEVARAPPEAGAAVPFEAGTPAQGLPLAGTPAATALPFGSSAPSPEPLQASTAPVAPEPGDRRVAPPVGETRAASYRQTPPGGAIPAPLVVAAAFAVAAVAAVVCLYQRAARAAVLRQETRRKLYEVIQADPGICLTEAARELSLDAKTVEYHARVLRKAGLLTLRRSPYGRELEMYPPCDLPVQTSSRDVLHLVETPVARAILSFLLQEGPSSRERIRGAVEGARSTLNWNLRRLAAAGAVVADPDGRLGVAPEASGRLRTALRAVATREPEPAGATASPRNGVSGLPAGVAGP